MEQDTMTADTFVEIAVTARSGAVHSVRFPFSPDRTYSAIFTSAHQNADGSLPTLEQFDGDATMLDRVRRRVDERLDRAMRSAMDAV